MQNDECRFFPNLDRQGFNIRCDLTAESLEAAVARFYALRRAWPTVLGVGRGDHDLGVLLTTVEAERTNPYGKWVTLVVDEHAGSIDWWLR